MWIDNCSFSCLMSLRDSFFLMKSFEYSVFTFQAHRGLMNSSFVYTSSRQDLRNVFVNEWPHRVFTQKMNLIFIKLPDFEFIHWADGSRVDDYCEAIDRQWVTRGQPPSHHPPSPTHTLGNWRWKSIIDVANGSHARPLESTSIFGYCHSRWTLFGEKKNGSMDTSFSCDESILNFFFFFCARPSLNISS